MQIADKEKQIQTFEQQTKKHVKELNDLKDQMTKLKSDSQKQTQEKQSLEQQLDDAKKENLALLSKSTEAASPSIGANPTPEQFLELLGQEKDL